MNLTVEQRKNTRPDIDRKDVVFAVDSGVAYSIVYTTKNEPVVVYEDKLKSSGHLDEIVFVSTNYINEDLKQICNDKIVEFACGDVLM